MGRHLFAVIVALAALAGAHRAVASSTRQVRYIGIHPIPKADGGGICYIEGPHVHIYEADDLKLQYRDYHGAHYFIGDPVAYGYDGKRVAYKGNHPIHVDMVVAADAPVPPPPPTVVVSAPTTPPPSAPPPDADVDVYCYINGPHFHYFAPPEGPEFKLAGDAYFYVGDPPHAYVEARPAMLKINAIYTPIVYARPVIDVEAPVGWIGARAEFAVEAPAVRAVVVPPSADISIHVPMPSVQIGVGVGVGVGAGVGVGVGGGVRVRHGHR
jgi:hypothetical protein